MINQTGYQRDVQGSWIAKDPNAQLIYSMDWTDWMPSGDTLTSATYSLQVRANDPAPLVRESQGYNAGTHLTYVELSGGQVGKVYTITVAITTTNGLEDRRNFRIRVENRSA